MKDATNPMRTKRSPAPTQVPPPAQAFAVWCRQKRSEINLTQQALAKAMFPHRWTVLHVADLELGKLPLTAGEKVRLLDVFGTKTIPEDAGDPDIVDGMDPEARKRAPEPEEELSPALLGDQPASKSILPDVSILESNGDDPVQEKPAQSPVQPSIPGLLEDSVPAGPWMRKERLDAGVQLQKMAGFMGLSTSTLVRIEKGIDIPTEEELNLWRAHIPGVPERVIPLRTKVRIAKVHARKIDTGKKAAGDKPAPTSVAVEEIVESPRTGTVAVETDVEIVDFDDSAVVGPQDLDTPTPIQGFLQRPSARGEAIQKLVTALNNPYIPDSAAVEVADKVREKVRQALSDGAPIGTCCDHPVT